MASNTRYIINMANSIVGVSILSMPYCFKEVGLILGLVLLLFCSFITKKTCLFLIRAAIMARRRSYEFLALSAYGSLGKLMVEVAMVLFLLGIGVSFHVVMGDLLPTIVSNSLQVPNTDVLRSTLLLGIVVCVVLPLCLLRNIDSLVSMSACSIGFYVVLVAVMFCHALPRLLDGSWLTGVVLADFSNMFHVLPIMCLALACQSNVFEIYDSVPEANVSNMRDVINGAMNLCSLLYAFVGIFGYIAFAHTEHFAGNIILAFPSSSLTEAIKIFFVVSIAISFPLLLFPCRTSIYSLLYRRNTAMSQDLVGNYMPEARFKVITVAVLGFSVAVGVLIPSIEFVLGLLGSTLGALISLVFPAMLFIRVNSKQSVDRLFAQGLMLLGVLVMVTGSYHLLVSHQYQETLDHELRVIGVTPRLQAVLDSVQSGQVAAEMPDGAGRLEPIAPEPPVLEDKIDDDAALSEKLKSDLKPVFEKIDKRILCGQSEVPDDPECKDGGGPRRGPEERGSDAKEKEGAAHGGQGETKVEEKDKTNENVKNNKEGKDKPAVAEKSEVDDKLARQEALLQQLEKQNRVHERIIEQERELLKQLQHHTNSALPPQLPLGQQQQLAMQQQPQLVQQQQLQVAQQQPQLVQGMQQQPQVVEQQPLLSQQQPQVMQQQPQVMQQQPQVVQGVQQLPQEGQQQQQQVAQQQLQEVQQQPQGVQQLPQEGQQQQQQVAQQLQEVQQQPQGVQQQPQLAQQQPYVVLEPQQSADLQQQSFVSQQHPPLSQKQEPAVSGLQPADQPSFPKYSPSFPQQQQQPALQQQPLVRQQRQEQVAPEQQLLFQQQQLPIASLLQQPLPSGPQPVESLKRQQESLLLLLQQQQQQKQPEKPVLSSPDQQQPLEQQLFASPQQQQQQKLASDHQKYPAGQQLPDAAAAAELPNDSAAMKASSGEAVQAKDVVKHDEERRRRRDIERGPSIKVIPARLSAPDAPLLLEDVSPLGRDGGRTHGVQVSPDEVVQYDTRQLLWLSRRRKRRRHQDQDYLDEI